MSHSRSFTQRYSEKIAYPTLFLTLAALSGYLWTGLAAFHQEISTGWVILINTIAAYLLFTPMHEAGHLNIAGNKSGKWINEMVGWISGISLLAPFYIFQIIHNQHHAHTNDPEKDPDHWLASKSLVSLIFHSVTIFPVYLVKAAQLLSNGSIGKKLRKDLQIGFFVFFLMVVSIVALGMTLGWGWVVQVWLIPAIIAQAFLALTFDWLPHHPHEKKGRYENSRIIDIPGLSVLFQGQNYHLIHHLYPRIPFYDYGKAYREIKEDLKKKEVEIVSVRNSNTLDA